MSETVPSLDEWKKLYDLMGKIKELRPWEWMEEQDIFAVEDPQTGEIGFVSVTGAVGEHYSITIYRGEEGLRRFWDFRDSYLEEDELVFQKLIEIPQLQASFENREYLFDEDLKIIETLGLSFSGRQAWPVFRKYEPGFVPWLINEAEAQSLITVLGQTIDVALRVRENDSILYPDEKKSILVRRCARTDTGPEWQDAVRQESVKAPPRIEYFSDLKTFDKIKHLPGKEISLEMDFFMSSRGVYEKGKKPYYPYLLLLLETNKGMIIGQELIAPLPDLASMWQKMPAVIAGKLLHISFLPAQIYVSSENLYESLRYLADYMSATINYVKKLRVAPEVRKSVMDYMNK